MTARIHTKTGATDRYDAWQAPDLVDDQVPARKQFLPADIIDLKDMIAVESGIDRARKNYLRVDYGGADDEADRNCELKHDEAGPKPS
jgi:hypothetical protein